MPKSTSSKEKQLNVKEDIMPFLRNLQERLDKVEVAMEKIILASNTEHFEDEQKIILTDSIVDEQMTEALAGLREDINDFIQKIFSPAQDITYLDSQTQAKIQMLREHINQFKIEIINDVVNELKEQLSEKPSLEGFKPKTTKKAAKKKPPKRSKKKKKS